MTNVGRIMMASAPRRVLIGRCREFSALVSLSYEFPGLPPTSPQVAKASKASVTTLPNGLTVVSEDASSTSTISLTFPKAGSNNEAVDETGAALANKCLAFKSGSGLSSVLIMRNLEDDGAVPFSVAGHTSATVGFTASPDKAERLIPLLATACSFETWDVRDAIEAAAMEAKIAGANAQVVLTEQLFSAAFGAQSPMGRPYYTAGASSPAVQSFRAKAYGIKGAVLAATGIADHAAFCTNLQACLAESPPGDSSKVATPVYMGGEARVHAPAVGTAHIALAFPAPSSSVLSNILKECLASTGVSAFTLDGLLGVYGSDVDALTAALTTKPTAEVIRRAKNKAKFTSLSTLEDGSLGLAKLMTALVLETGTFPVSYDSVTEKDVSAAYTAMLKSRLTMASVGDLSAVPYYGTVQSRFS